MDVLRAAGPHVLEFIQRTTGAGQLIYTCSIR
jgi:hypothetical protein